MRTGHRPRPETLLTGIDTALAELVVLAPAVLAREERPFRTLFLAPAHKSPGSGGFLCGAGLSGVLRSAHSRFASSRRSRMEGFFSGVVLMPSRRQRRHRRPLALRAAPPAVPPLPSYCLMLQRQRTPHCPDGPHRADLCYAPPAPTDTAPRVSAVPPT